MSAAGLREGMEHSLKKFVGKWAPRTKRELRSSIERLPDQNPVLSNLMPPKVGEHSVSIVDQLIKEALELGKEGRYTGPMSGANTQADLPSHRGHSGPMRSTFRPKPTLKQRIGARLKGQKAHPGTVAVEKAKIKAKGGTRGGGLGKLLRRAA